MQYFNTLSVLICCTWFVSVSVDAAGLSRPCGDLSPDCLKRSLQTALPGFVRGFPEIGIQPLDPFEVDDLKLTLRGGLQIHFTKGVAKGFRNCQIGYAKVNSGIMEVNVRCNLTVKGKYKSSGRLLLFTIDGEGDSLIRCRDLELTVRVALSTKTRGGLSYLYVDQFTSSHKYRGQVSYRMTNLIRNSPQVSQAVLAFMNSNWRTVAEEFGDPIVQYGVDAVMANVRKLLDHVPAQDLPRTGQ